MILENYIVKSLSYFDDISYDDHSDLLYNLTGQLLSYVRSYQSVERNVVNILQCYSKRNAELIHAQMLEHQVQNITDYDVKVTKGFITLRNSNYSIDAAEMTRNFRAPIDNPQQIKSMQFGGFEKCLYPIQQFHSDSERRFSIILENDLSVIK